MILQHIGLFATQPSIARIFSSLSPSKIDHGVFIVPLIKMLWCSGDTWTVSLRAKNLSEYRTSKKKKRKKGFHTHSTPIDIIADVKFGNFDSFLKLAITYYSIMIISTLPFIFDTNERRKTHTHTHTRTIPYRRTFLFICRTRENFRNRNRFIIILLKTRSW